MAGAILLALAYPPFHLLLPTFVCLIPAVILVERAGTQTRPVRWALQTGFWYGVAAHGLVLYWMVVALWHFTPMSALGYLATVAILSGWMSLVFAGTAWIRARTALPMVLVFPVLWTAAEWMMGHQGDLRFPWVGLGTSLTGFPTLIQAADTIGARGLTLLLAAANVLLLEAWRQRGTLDSARRLFLVSVGVLGAL
ncbi:MAG: hypothetical protein WD043_12425, partial [Gemmatimonadales bacterium]